RGDSGAEEAKVGRCRAKPASSGWPGICAGSAPSAGCRRRRLRSTPTSTAPTSGVWSAARRTRPSLSSTGWPKCSAWPPANSSPNRTGPNRGRCPAGGRRKPATDRTLSVSGLPVYRKNLLATRRQRSAAPSANDETGHRKPPMVTVKRPQRIFSFSDHSQMRPKEPPPGDRLDAQFHELSAAIKTTQDALAELRRDDGKLNNQTVTEHHLVPGLLSSIKENLVNELAPFALSVAGASS